MECIKLKTINIEEKEILDVETKNKLFKSHIGKCIDASMIKNVLNTTSKYYLDHGYITTKPYLPPQNILDGEIKIYVSKGIIEDIVDANTSSSNAKIKTAFIFEKGKLLNLRDLETFLEMINRVPSTDAKFEIKPDKKQSSSIVIIKIKETTPYHVEIGVTGEKNLVDDNPYLTANISIDNPFNINDILKFTYNGSRIQQDYQSSSGKELNYSFALGSYLMEYIWYDFLYSQSVLGLNDTYISDGNTVGFTLKVSKLIFRNKNNKLKLALSLGHKNTKNYFSDELIEVSSYKTTLAQVDFTHTYIQNWGQLINTYSFRGTDWFGARKDNYLTGNEKEKLQFSKHTLSTDLYYFFPENTYQINSNLHLQYSGDYLYDNNKLRVGSYYTVRGYSSSYYGDSGFYFKNDLLKTFRPDFYPDYVQTISPFIGLDYGYVECRDNNNLACGKLIGAAIGFKTESKKINTDFTWSRAVKKVPNLKLETLFKYNLTLRF
ncbi:ShlB/FhaC/HecB family hemolysin secretion/activation protein [Sulfurimonas sp.]